MWLKEAVEEFGQNNIRVFMDDQVANHGFFRNPFAGRNEYKIVEFNPHHKVTLELVDHTNTRHPDMAFMSQRQYYVQDFHRIQFRSLVDMYVLVDVDNKYEKIPH